MHDIRLIASDMDGTMLNNQTQISARTAAALKAAQQMGITVAVCSGRFPEFASRKLHEVGLSCPIIGGNGSVVWDDEKRKVIASCPISLEASVAVSTLLQAYGAYYFVFMPGAVITSDALRPHPYSGWQDGILCKQYGMRFGNSAEEAMASAASGEATKYFVSLKGLQRADELCEEVRKIPGIYITSSGTNNIEIMREDVNKCMGVTFLTQKLGISMQNVMTFGDYLNDIPMIQAAGLGVAMGNALEEVKNVADYVTDTNDNDGVAKAIEKFVL